VTILFINLQLTIQLQKYTVCYALQEFIYPNMNSSKLKPSFCAIEDISTFEHRGCFQHSLFKYSSAFHLISSFLKFSNLEDEFILFEASQNDVVFRIPKYGYNHISINVTNFCAQIYKVEVGHL
jgi:hypothetical protein